jgi:hypothetical protein
LFEERQGGLRKVTLSERFSVADDGEVLKEIISFEMDFVIGKWRKEWRFLLVKSFD